MAKIKISKNGPYVISGNLPLAKEIIIKDDSGYSVRWEKGDKYPDQETYSLCRCGKSRNKPYCDGAHLNGFDGAETASKEKYADQADEIAGPDLILTDAPDFCFGAGFCHNKKGDVWRLTENSDKNDSKELAIKEACNCPSGRLVACDKKTGIPIEKNFKPSISLIEEPGKGVSGPVWVKGKVPIESSDGTKYERRNRVTLCRCGSSQNKPFCDGSHVLIGFNDENKAVKR